MKSKLQKILRCFLVIVFLLTGTIPVFANGNTRTVSEAQSFIQGIVTYQQNKTDVTSIQGWLNASLTKNAGSSSEWYVIALSQYGDYDFSSYQKALLTYLNSNEVASASSRQKYALALVACGSTDTYIYNVLNNSIGKQGVMSWIFGLHLLNNGYSGNDYSLSDVKQKLLSLQLSDGGWAITGSNGDVDVTAMAIQSLAPYYKTDSAVKTAIDKALNLLANRQKKDGDYASYGVNNPESTAQVLVALSSLGIDCETDSRFIKNGNTLFDGIALYRLSDGSFCHKQGGTSNATATVQVFCSMVSYIRMKNGQSPIYIFDARNPSELKIPTEQASKPADSDTSSSSDVNFGTTKPTNSTSSKKTDEASSSVSASSDAAAPSSTTQSSANTSKQSDISEQSGAEKDNAGEIPDNSEAASSVLDNSDLDNSPSGTVGYKIWVCFAIIIIAGGTCVILYCCKKRNIRNFIVIAVMATAAIIVVLITNFQSADSYYNQADKNKSNGIGKVSITIRCDTVPDKSAEHIPDDGVVLDACELEIEDGDTVYDVLSEATAKNKIHLETSGNADSVYVKGISNIYEFDFGDLSGWMYFVNGESSSVSCGEYILSDADEIEWLYTCNIGKDLKNESITDF